MAAPSLVSASSLPAARDLDLIGLETPALLLFERQLLGNLERMQALADRRRLRLRPHAKAHKCPPVAVRQLAAGAVGVCCQTVAEVEAFASHGIADILLTNEVADGAKAARLAAVARSIRLGVCVDSPIHVTMLSTACRELGSCVDIYIEAEVGGGRCGVRDPLEAVEIAGLVASAGSLRLGGLQAYDGGAQHIEDPAERAERAHRAAARTATFVQALAAAGHPGPIVTGSGTGTCELDAASGIVGELQAGSYCLMDVDYLAVRRGSGPGETPSSFEPSVFVVTTVISTAPPEGVVVDAGLKAMSFDRYPPLVAEDPVDIAYRAASDEHGLLEVGTGGAAPCLGDRLLLIPSHCDPTVALHSRFLVIRGGRVEEDWPIVARTASSADDEADRRTLRYQEQPHHRARSEGR